MPIEFIRIKNWKSLKDVEFKPGQLACIIGPNGSGKSNLLSAIGFLGNCFRYSLKDAVLQAGGMDSVLNQIMRDYDPFIEFELQAKVTSKERYKKYVAFTDEGDIIEKRSFRIGSYDNKVRVIKQYFSLEDDSQSRYYNIAIKENGHLDIKADPRSELEIDNQLLFPDPFDNLDIFYIGGSVLHSLLHWTRSFHLTDEGVMASGIRFREDDIEPSGKNLPIFIENMKTEKQALFYQILDTLKQIYPTIEDLLVKQLEHDRSQGLFIKELGFDKDWNTLEISKGTLFALVNICILFDPRYQFIAIDEIEDSLHPSAVRVLMENIRKASESKQIVLTTHSMQVVDLLLPEEIWCMYRIEEGYSELKPLLELDPTIQERYDRGQRISNMLSLAMLPEYIPGVGDTYRKYNPTA